MKGMILAAGYGTRFRPVTFDIPKPMVPLCNRPLICYAVDSLIEAGVREIVVNLHHLPDVIERYLPQRYQGAASFAFSYEKEILGTGGGIRKVRHLLENEQTFALVNGDTVQEPPFRAMEKRLSETAAVAVLLLRHPPEKDRFTKVFFDGRLITGFGDGTGEALMFSGSHVLTPRIFELLPDRDFSGITEDCYIPLLRDPKEHLAGFVDDGLWFDIGTPARYLSASDSIRRLMLDGRMAIEPGSSSSTALESIVADSARIEGHASRSIIGREALVKASARVSETVVWERAVVGEGAELDRSIVAFDAEVPKGARLSNVLVCRRREDVDYPEEVQLEGHLAIRPIDESMPVVVEL